MAVLGTIVQEVELLLTNCPISGALVRKQISVTFADHANCNLQHIQLMVLRALAKADLGFCEFNLLDQEWWQQVWCRLCVWVCRMWCQIILTLAADSS